MQLPMRSRVGTAHPRIWRSRSPGSPSALQSPQAPVLLVYAQGKGQGAIDASQLDLNAVDRVGAGIGKLHAQASRIVAVCHGLQVTMPQGQGAGCG